MLSLALSSLALSIAAQCSDSTDCNSCIQGDYCAWCAPGDAKYPDGEVVERALDTRLRQRP